MMLNNQKAIWGFLASFAFAIVALVLIMWSFSTPVDAAAKEVCNAAESGASAENLISIAERETAERDIQESYLVVLSVAATQCDMPQDALSIVPDGFEPPTVEDFIGPDDES